METVRFTLAALAALALAVPGARATVLYKSIGPHGVIQFSDTPPENGTVVEERIVSDTPRDGQAMVGVEGALLAFENRLELAAEGADADDALARANAQVDLAEHQLALARNDTWDRREGLRLSFGHRSPADDERIAFYERNLAAARAKLLTALKETFPGLSLPDRGDGSVRQVAVR